MSRQRKYIRIFNGKPYVRAYNTRNVALALQIKNKLKSDGKYALIVHSGPFHQVWTRKRSLLTGE